LRKNAYDEQLVWFKQNEVPETVLFVTDDSLLRKIVVAWESMRTVRKQRLSKCESETENDTWEWLWKNTEYSREDLLARIPNSDKQIEAKFHALRKSRVLYPDGTVNSYVARYLREQVRRQFPSLKRGISKTSS